jgi:hypothetical protein
MNIERMDVFAHPFILGYVFLKARGWCSANWHVQALCT